jgi:hypothetical protein
MQLATGREEQEMKWFGVVTYGLAVLTAIALGIAAAGYVIYVFLYRAVVSMFD